MGPELIAIAEEPQRKAASQVTRGIQGITGLLAGTHVGS